METEEPIIINEYKEEKTMTNDLNGLIALIVVGGLFGGFGNGIGGKDGASAVVGSSAIDSRFNSLENQISTASINNSFANVMAGQSSLSREHCGIEKQISEATLYTNNNINLLGKDVNYQFCLTNNNITTSKNDILTALANQNLEALRVQASDLKTELALSKQTQKLSEDILTGGTYVKCDPICGNNNPLPVELSGSLNVINQLPAALNAITTEMRTLSSKIKS